MSLCPTCGQQLIDSKAESAKESTLGLATGEKLTFAASSVTMGRTGVKGPGNVVGLIEEVYPDVDGSIALVKVNVGNEIHFVKPEHFVK